MKNLIKYFWPIVLIALSFFNDMFAQCYNLYYASSSSVWHWTSSSVIFYVNSYGSRFFPSPHNTESNAIGRAFTTWQNVAPASISFTNGGFENATIANDGKNVLYWRDDNNVDSLVVASLTMWGNSYTGVLTNVDIWFNDRYYQWTDGTLIFDSNIMDIQSIATHEIGHLLGLDHSDPCTINAPTMMSEGLWKTYFKSEAESPNLGLRSLAQGDMDGLNYMYGSNLRVPQIFTTIEQAVGFAQPGQTIQVNNGNYTLNNNLIISSGVVLQLNPGVTMNFVNGTSLIVNGTLNAVGNSNSRITFTRSGTSGTWGGIVVNSGAYAYIQYCDINYASTGVTINNNSNRSQVTDCQINNNDYYGISIYNSQPTLQRNKIINSPSGGAFGIFCNYYGYPFVKDNLIKGYGTSGVYCVDHSGVYWLNSTANNIIKTNQNGLYLNNYSNAYLGNNQYNGQNSIYSNTGYDVKAIDNSIAYVQSTWWGVYPPNPNKFYNDGGSTIDRANPLTYDPNNSLNLFVASDAGYNNSHSLTQNILQSENDDKKEIEEQLDLFKKNVSNKEGMEALQKIERLFTQYARKDFVDFSKKELRPLIKEKDRLYPLLLELEMHQLLINGNQKEALSINDVLEKEVSDKTANKLALFRKGFIYLTEEKNKPEAEKVFGEFITKYPEDELTAIVNYALGKPNEFNKAVTLFEEEKIAPEGFELFDNYPNPFNPTTTIRYQIPQDGHISLKVYDMLGREVAQLVNEHKKAGEYTVGFDGSKLSSGVYIYKLIGNNVNLSKKMILMK